jgi:hypothetical protein
MQYCSFQILFIYLSSSHKKIQCIAKSPFKNHTLTGRNNNLQQNKLENINSLDQNTTTVLEAFHSNVKISDIPAITTE